MIPKSGSPLERFLRAVALLAVFAGVLWAFEARFSRLAERYAARQTVYDETGELSDADRDFLRQAAEDLKARFGIELAVRVFRGDVEVPDPSEKTVFIGISTQKKTAGVTLPPLVARALGPDFAGVLERDVLAVSLAKGQWPMGLRAAVVFLERELSGLDSGEGYGDGD